MIIQILKEEINSLVRRDDDLKLLLSKRNGVKVVSIDRWLREDNVMLTTATNLDLIRSHFEIDSNETLTVEVEKEEIR